MKRVFVTLLTVHYIGPHLVPWTHLPRERDQGIWHLNIAQIRYLILKLTYNLTSAEDSCLNPWYDDSLCLSWKVSWYLISWRFGWCYLPLLFLIESFDVSIQSEHANASRACPTFHDIEPSWCLTDSRSLMWFAWRVLLEFCEQTRLFVSLRKSCFVRWRKCNYSFWIRLRNIH